jgi:hypothetical protein
MNTLLASVILALITVESGGDPNAIGDNGNAVGALQIWPIVITDVNNIAGTHYTLEDRKDRNKSIEIATIYLNHYCSEKRLGRKATAEDYARCWNSGPAWRTKMHKTDGYWARVKKELK